MMKNIKSPWRLGESYKNGKLYIFDSRRILVVRPWPKPMAWYKTAKKSWKPTRRYPNDLIQWKYANQFSLPPLPSNIKFWGQKDFFWWEHLSSE